MKKVFAYINGRRNQAIAVAILFALAGTVLLRLSLAAQPALFLSPGSSTVTQGNSFIVEVRVNTTDQINVVQANLTYPSNLLQLNSVSTNNSAFGIQAENATGNGFIRLGRGTQPNTSVSGNQLVATLTFTPTASGTAALNFAADSYAVRSTDNTTIDGGVGSSYMIKSPPAPQPATGTNPGNPGTPSPGPPPSGGGNSPSGSTPSGSNTPPGAKTPNAAGNNQPQGKPSSGQPVPAGNQETGQPPDTAEDTVSTGSDAGPAAVSIRIKVLDDSYQPVKNASIMLNGKSVTSDEEGIASFTSVDRGPQKVNVTYNGRSTTADIEVGQKDQQTYIVSVPSKAGGTVWGLPLVLFFIALAVAFWFTIAKRHHVVRPSIQAMPLETVVVSPDAGNTNSQVAGGVNKSRFVTQVQQPDGEQGPGSVIRPDSKK